MTKGDIETYYEDGRWKNRPEGNARASDIHDTKAAAQAAGRATAIKRGVEHVIKRGMGPSSRRTLIHAVATLAHQRARYRHP